MLYCISLSWRWNLQKITTMVNYPLFLVPCNLRICKSVPIWILNLIGYAKDCRRIFSFPYGGGRMIVFSTFSLSSGSKNSKWSCSHWNSYKWLISIQELPWRKKKKKSPDRFLITKAGHLISVVGDFFLVALWIQAIHLKWGSYYWEAVGYSV